MDATNMTPALRGAALAVLTERWERELKALGVDQGRAIEEVAKLKTDREIWWALKNGA